MTLRGTRKGGPKWENVIFRETKDLSSGETVERRHRVKGLSRAAIYMPIDKARNLETTLYYCEGMVETEDEVDILEIRSASVVVTFVINAATVRATSSHHVMSRHRNMPGQLTSSHHIIASRQQSVIR